MELMTGVVFLVQSSLFFLSLIFMIVAFVSGQWWKVERNEGYELDFTLWKLCSRYEDYDQLCLNLNKYDHHLTSVILTTRACMSLSLLLSGGLLCFIVYWIIQQRRGDVNDRWLRARNVLLNLLVLFLMVSIAHAHHCPPCYKLSHTQMKSSTSWAWNLTLAAFVFVLPPFVLHLYEDVATWWSDRNKS